MSGASLSCYTVLASHRIRTCFKPFRTIRDILVHPKDPVSPEKVNGVVYRISCNDCDMAYVGQTGRTLNHCRTEHIRALRSADPNLSAVVEHLIQWDHNIAWDGAEILARNPRMVQRCAMEAWYIRSERNPMNRDSGTFPSTCIYNILLPTVSPHS